MATYKQIVKELSKYFIDITHIPQKEVEILLLYIIKQNPIWLHINYNNQCECYDKLKSMVLKRATNYPLEYITSRVSFYGETFNINDKVLIPRPQTEILIQKAYDILKNIISPTIVEVGTGSGVISIILAKLIPSIKIVAVDINNNALQLALQNAKKFNVDENIKFIKSDIFNDIDILSFDMCISNPPYIKDGYVLPSNVKFEPLNALFGGKNGDELLKKIITNTYSNNIKYLCCEMGYDQKNSLNLYLKDFAIKNIEFYKDYEKFDRGFIVEFIYEKEDLL